MRMGLNILLSALFVLAMVPAAWAQNALGDGRGLDRNLRVGSGGTNDFGVSNNYGEAAQALVTGNTAGFGRFRGHLGYTPGNQFHGTLGSSSNFDFYRRSSSLGPGLSARASTFSSYTGNYEGLQALSPYSSGALRVADGLTTTAGQVTGQYQPYNVGPNSFTPSTSALSIGDAQRVSDSARTDLPSFANNPRLGVGQGGDGRLLEYSASPLTGLTSRNIPQPAFPQAPVPKAVEPDNRQIGATPDAAAEDDPRGTLPTAMRLNQALATPSWALGQRIESQVQGTPRLSATYEQQARTIEDRMFLPLASGTARPGEDVYLDLLRQIKQQQADRQIPVDRLAGARPEELGADGKTAAQRYEEQLNQRVEAYVAARRQAAEDSDAAKAAADTPEEGEEPEGKKKGHYERVIRELDYDLPALQSLAGSGDSALARAMARAEQYMQQARYFDAEHAYDAAVGVRPGYPLAMIGRANAQLGAGLFLSAGRSLYATFTQHPELISTRYAAPIVPGPERAEYLEKNLRRVLEKHEGVHLPLVLAYLGHQQHRPAMVQEGLELMRQADDRDPLVPLVERLWLSKATSPPSGKP
jgi:hypothetical protein